MDRAGALRSQVLGRELRALRRRKSEAEAPPEGKEAPPPVIPARLFITQPRLAEMLGTLDSAQLAAVLSEAPNVLVRAQVGSGKTTVLVHKVLVLHLALGVPLEKIAVLTFTTKAAAEIRARLTALGAAATSSETWLMGTFHGVARTLLSRALPIERLGFKRDFQVLDEEASEALLAEIVDKEGLRVGRKRSLRRRLREAGASRPSDVDPELARLIEVYTERKRAANVLDFDDLIHHASALLEAHPPLAPSWILVDEAQDCQPKEVSFLARLRTKETCVFSVGDPLQSIYGWRAPQLSSQSATELLAPFAEGSQIYTLPSSYRSTRNILEAASAVLGLQPVSTGALHPVREHGAPIVIRRHHDPIAEAIYLGDRIHALLKEGLPPTEVAVLARKKSQLEVIRPIFAGRGIAIAEDSDGAGGVRLLTIHAAKGLELRQVFISGANRGLIPLAHGATSEAEERRLLFVGMTRARDHLEVGYHACPSEAQATGFLSPFLDTLPAALADRREGPTAPDKEPSPSAPAADPSPWSAGQVVRHPRYGAGTVLRIHGGAVECDFGKLGQRAFPLRLCPLIPVPAQNPKS